MKPSFVFFCFGWPFGQHFCFNANLMESKNLQWIDNQEIIIFWFGCIRLKQKYMRKVPGTLQFENFNVLYQKVVFQVHFFEYFCQKNENHQNLRIFCKSIKLLFDAWNLAQMWFYLAVLCKIETLPNIWILNDVC